jgi:energy-coupling factor transporter ATPase
LYRIQADRLCPLVVAERSLAALALVCQGAFSLPFIRIEKLTHTYVSGNRAPIPALRGIDLTIDAGEYVCLVGANGSGKTTLARHLNALLLPSTGDVWIDGHHTCDPSAVRAIRSDVAMIFQSPADQIVATVVQEDVAFGPENLGVPEEDLANVVRASLQRVGMWSVRHRPPHLLSAGQQQRVAIAGALAMDPRCLVCDEATAMLDPAARDGFLDILDELHNAGLTIVSISHSMSEAARAERVIVMSRGQIALDGPPRQVFASDELASLGLELPPAADLARRLRRFLPALPVGLLTPDELADALLEAAM